MRFPTCSLPLLLTLASCSPDGRPEPDTAPEPSGPPMAAAPVVAPASAAAAAPPEAPATGVAPDAAAPVSAAPATSADAGVQQAAARIFAGVGTGDLRAIATAPAELAKLGAAALPSIAHELARGGLPQRRVAALSLLQFGPAAAPAVAALRAATGDADPHVRAAAEHALRIATGDTSDLDRLRARHEAAERQDR